MVSDLNLFDDVNSRELIKGFLFLTIAIHIPKYFVHIVEILRCQSFPFLMLILGAFPYLFFNSQTRPFSSIGNSLSKLKQCKSAILLTESVEDLQHNNFLSEETYTLSPQQQDLFSDDWGHFADFDDDFLQENI